MLDRFRIEERITEIRKRLRQLKETAEKVVEEKFLTDTVMVDAVERRLQIAIQACMDIANHIVAQMALEKPKIDDKEIFLILGKHKIISEDLAKKLTAMAGMRNILVHQYLEIQSEKVYHAIKYDLSDIEEFVTQIQKFLDRVSKRKIE